MTVSSWVRLAIHRLAEAGIGSPALEAQILAGHVLLVDRSFILSHPDHDFPELAGETLLLRREMCEPLAYILGSREFYGRQFQVGPGVLIPRHETETLVEAALSFLKSKIQNPKSKILDLGTGSGCIAITIKLEAPAGEVIASDISIEALVIARDNANALKADVRLLESDAFAALGGKSFDLIVTNPPYVGLHEALPPEVREFEPAVALYGGHAGLEFYERLAREAAEFLMDGGRLMMEVGYRQAQNVAVIFESCGWSVVEIIKDLSGTDRVVVVQPVIV